MLVFVWYALLNVDSSFAIILTRKKELVALLLCLLDVLWLFLTVLWISLQCVFVVFPDYAHLLFETKHDKKFQDNETQVSVTRKCPNYTSQF